MREACPPGRVHRTGAVGRRLTLDLELYAPLPIVKLQMLVRKPSALERWHHNIIAAVHPQEVHCLDIAWVGCRHQQQMSRLTTKVLQLLAY